MKGEVSVGSMITSIFVFLLLAGGFYYMFIPAYQKYQGTPEITCNDDSCKTISPLNRTYSDTSVLLNNITEVFKKKDTGFDLAATFNLLVVFGTTTVNLFFQSPTIISNMIEDMNSSLPAGWQIPVWLITLIGLLILAFITFKAISILFSRSDT